MFDIISGSVIGSEHLRKNLNNQDSVQEITQKGYQVAVVCDGCSAGLHSEVGAKLFSQIILSKSLLYAPQMKFERIPLLISKVLQKRVSEISKHLSDFYQPQDLLQKIQNYFLTTFLAAISKVGLFTNYFLFQTQKPFSKTYPNLPRR